MNVKFIAYHDIAYSLKPEYSSGILFFHARTGCVTVSAFERHGIKQHAALS